MAASADLLDGSARRSVRFFAGCFVAGLLAVAGVNYAVDPLDDWGNPLGIAPVEANDRPNVAEHLAGEGRRAQIIVMGSSHSGSVPADYIAQRTGLPAFNSSVQGARIETILTAWRYAMAQRAEPPKLLIVGVDTACFLGELDSDTWRSSELGPYFPWRVTAAVRLLHRRGAFVALFALHTLQASERAVLQARAPAAPALGETAPAATDAPDARRDLGLTTPHNRTVRRARDYWRRYQARRLSPARVQWLTDLARDCARGGTGLVMYLTPLHPMVHDAAVKHGSYPRLKGQAWALMTELSRDLPGVVALDLSEVDKFGGSAEEFLDGVHCTEANGRLVAKACLGAWERSHGHQSPRAGSQRRAAVPTAEPRPVR